MVKIVKRNSNKLAVPLIAVLIAGLFGDPAFCNQYNELILSKSHSGQSLENVVKIAGRPIHVWNSLEIPAKASLLCVHGLGLSSTDYDRFGNHFANHGIRTFAISVDGFGPAKERPETARLNFETTIKGIERTIEEIRKNHPQEPVFLLGESLGGTIALEFASRFPDKIDGLICSTPTWHYYGEGTVRLRALASLIFGHRARRILITQPIVTRATSDPELRKHWLFHPDHRLDLTIKEACGIVNYIRKTPSRAKKIQRMPIFFVQGLNDRLCKPRGVARLFCMLPSQNKQLVLDCGQEHVIFEEGRFSSDSAAVLLEWLSLQTEKRSLNEMSHPSGILISNNVTNQKTKSQVKKFFKTANLQEDIIEYRTSLGYK